MKLKKGDKVKILLGKDRGKTGTIDQVLVKDNRVLVGGLNVYKKHLKSRGEGAQNRGGIVDQSRPIAVSKVILVCPKCGKIARVGYEVENKIKSRICRVCKGKI